VKGIAAAVLDHPLSAPYQKTYTTSLNLTEALFIEKGNHVGFHFYKPNPVVVVNLEQVNVNHRI